MTGMNFNEKPHKREAVEIFIFINYKQEDLFFSLKRVIKKYFKLSN